MNQCKIAFRCCSPLKYISKTILIIANAFRNASLINKPKLVAPNISSKAFTAFIILKSKHITSPFSDKFHNRLPSFDTWQSIDELVPLCNVSTNSLFFSKQKILDSKFFDFKITFSKLLALNQTDVNQPGGLE